MLIGLVAFGLAACQPRIGATTAAAPTPAATSESDYQAPPNLTSAVRAPGSGVRLVGRSAPGDRVRLASPAGEALYAVAGPDGVWTLLLPARAEPRLFGLSVNRAGRSVQAEGYVALTPQGVAAQLRSGAGARVLSDRTDQPVILAVDYDSKGGAVVSGRASPRATLDLWVDGARRARGAAGADGQFSLPLDEPLGFSPHDLDVADGPRTARANLDLSLARPILGGAYRAVATPAGWRLDWITPGGGLQTTVLLGRGAAGI